MKRRHTGNICKFVFHFHSCIETNDLVDRDRAENAGITLSVMCLPYIRWLWLACYCTQNWHQSHCLLITYKKLFEILHAAIIFLVFFISRGISINTNVRSDVPPAIGWCYFLLCSKTELSIFAKPHVLNATYTIPHHIISESQLFRTIWQCRKDWDLRHFWNKLEKEQNIISFVLWKWSGLFPAIVRIILGSSRTIFYRNCVFWFETVYHVPLQDFLRWTILDVLSTLNET